MRLIQVGIIMKRVNSTLTIKIEMVTALYHHDDHSKWTHDDGVLSYVFISAVTRLSSAGGHKVRHRIQ